MPDPLVVDMNGEPIEVGSIVRGDHTLPSGHVTRITELEGDTDDEGRMRAIYPKVHVLWSDEEDVEKFPTSTDARHQDDDPEPWWCLDVELVGPIAKEDTDEA